MRMLTLSVASREETTARAVAAFAGEPPGARIAFASVDLLWRVVNPKRLAILRAMTGAGALTIRELARRVGRGAPAFQADVSPLVAGNVLASSGDG